eukprot:547494-Prymnesium_polylepis.1
MACVWALQTTFADSLRHTWLTVFGYCRVYGDDGAGNATRGEPLGDPPSAWHTPNNSEPDVWCTSPGQLYIACLYWAMM